MYQTISAEPTQKDENVSVSTLLLVASGVLMLLVLALYISLLEPEWMNFLWLSVATVSLAAVAGWVIGHFLDALFEDVV
jgi:fatty-acid desaturase